MAIHTLTTDLDTFAGTAGNDIFNAPASVVSGQAFVDVTTLGAADVIDGGAGVDTLNLVATATHNNVLVGTVKNVEKINITGSDFISATATVNQQQAVATAQNNLSTAQTANTAAVNADTAAAAEAAQEITSATLFAAGANMLAADAVSSSVLTADYLGATTPAEEIAIAVQAATNAADISTSNADNAVAQAVINAAGQSGATLATVQAAAALALATYTDAYFVAGTADQAAVDLVTSTGTTAAQSNVAVTAQAVTDAQAALVTAQAAVGHSVVNAAFFAGSTDIAVDGITTDITNVTTQNVAFNGGAGINSGVSYAAGVNSGNVALNNTSGSLPLSGAALNTVTVTGGLTVKAGTVVAEDQKLINDDTDTVSLNITAGTAQTSLVVNADSALNLAVSGTKLVSLDTTGVANGIYLNSVVSLTTVKTGAGADIMNLTTSSVKDTVSTSLDETVNVLVDTGAGNDDMSISALGDGVTTINTGAGNDALYLGIELLNSRALGTVNVDLGAGDDVLVLNNTLETVLTMVGTEGGVTTSDVKLAGGAGVDTLSINDNSISATTYERLALNVTGFETLEFSNSATNIQADKLSQFSTLVFGSSDSVVNVSAAQTLVMNNGLTATAAGFVLDSDAVTNGNQPTYAGTLNVISSAGFNNYLTANADVVNLTVVATATAIDTNIKEHVGTNLDSSEVYIDGGNFQTLNAALQSVRGSGTSAGGESVSYLSVGDDAEITGLTAINVTGQGVVDIYADGIAGTTLKTIDVSGMTAFLNLDADGAQVTGSGFGYQNLSTTLIQGNDAVAETIKLGGAQDTVLTSSFGANMDTITGFSLTAGTIATEVDLAKSDSIRVNGATLNVFAEVVIEAGNSTLSLALDQVARGTVDQALFVSGGDTYIFVDGDAQTTTYNAASDIVIKLSGTYDLDLLTQVVGTAP